MGAVMGSVMGPVMGAVMGPVMRPVMGPVMGPVIGAVMGPIMGPVMGSVMGTVMGVVMGMVMVQLGPNCRLHLGPDRKCQVGAGAIIAAGTTMAQPDSQSCHKHAGPAEYKVVAMSCCCRAARGYCESREQAKQAE